MVSLQKKKKRERKREIITTRKAFLRVADEYIHRGDGGNFVPRLNLLSRRPLVEGRTREHSCKRGSQRKQLLNPLALAKKNHYSGKSYQF